MKQQQQYKVIKDYLCIKMPQEIDHHNAQIISRNADRFICEEKHEEGDYLAVQLTLQNESINQPMTVVVSIVSCRRLSRN